MFANRPAKAEKTGAMAVYFIHTEGVCNIFLVDMDSQGPFVSFVLLKFLLMEEVTNVC